MLLDVQKSKSGDSLVIIDPGGDVHACPTAEEFWTTVRSIIDSPDMPEKEQAAPPRRGNGVGGGGGYDGDEDDVVAELGGRLLSGILGGLQNISYRGKPPRQRSKKKPPEEESGGG